VVTDSLSSFTDNGPWELRLDRLPWRKELDVVRADARARVPGLVRGHRLVPLFRLAKTGTFLAVAVIGWMVSERRQGGSTSRTGISRRLRRACERLGPTYIKLGQIISSGHGILPDELVAEFSGLRDRVPAEPFEVVRQVVERELGHPLKEVFDRFDGEPTAAASIAQVHMATLLTGEDVAVKVQRPEIDRLVRQDIAVMAWLAPKLARRIDILKVVNLPAVIELFAETIVEELDFRLEAENMLDIAAVLDRSGQMSIVVPRPHPTLVSRRLLVMERMHGFAFTDVAGMRAANVDTAAVIRACLVSVLEGAMIYGVFHGDLHAGNLLIQRDGRVALLDFGITGRLDDGKRQVFLRMLLAAMTGDHRSVLVGYQDLGAISREADLDEFIREIPVDRPAVDPANASADQMITEMRRVTKALVKHGTRLPKELMLFLKDFMFIDGAIATLAPDLDVLGEMLHLSQYFMRQHGAQLVSEIGLDPENFELDPSSWAATMGVDEKKQTLTHEEIQRQRQAMRATMEAHRHRRRRR
jgi:ubiquinone biosynthesis protein